MKKSTVKDEFVLKCLLIWRYYRDSTRRNLAAAKAYTIYRSTKKDGGFIRLKIVKGAKKTAFLDNKVKKGKTYYYKVVVKTKKGYSATKAAKGAKVKR